MEFKIDKKKIYTFIKNFQGEREREREREKETVPIISKARTE